VPEAVNDLLAVIGGLQPTVAAEAA